MRLIVGGSVVYLSVFLGLSVALHPNAPADTLFIRGFGTLALLLLHVTLAIGPLCRINSGFSFLLASRRHLGVAAFLGALAHGTASLIHFHAFGDVNPLASLFALHSFQLLGFAALVILFFLAATSHDFWVRQLTPRVWKGLHMLVYAAYALLVAHVSFGALQSETSPVLPGVLCAGMAVLITLHLLAGYLPARIGSRAAGRKAVAACLLGLSVATAAVLAAGQAPFAASVASGQYRDYEGELILWPYPTLWSGKAAYLLVAPGKHGATALLKNYDGQNLHVRGALMQRGDQRMLEIAPESIRVSERPRVTLFRYQHELGTVTLTGEIVDSKCFFGAMNPGRGVVHSDCARRCISGGIPPAFLVSDSGGVGHVLLLTGSDGRALRREVLPFVAAPVTITGKLVRTETTLVLEAEPSEFHFQNDQ